MELSADLLVAERRLLTAARTADVDALDALFDDRLILIEPDGSPQGKADHIALFASSELHLDVLEPEAIDAVVEGTTGVTRMTLAIEGEASGEPFAIHMVTTRTWTLTPRGWRVLAIQANITETAHAV
jgi:hypothetical protein